MANTIATNALAPSVIGCQQSLMVTMHDKPFFVFTRGVCHYVGILSAEKMIENADTFCDF